MVRCVVLQLVQPLYDIAGDVAECNNIFKILQISGGSQQKTLVSPCWLDGRRSDGPSDGITWENN